MLERQLEADATLETVEGTLRNPPEFIRRVVANFYSSGLELSNAVVRIGTMGGGIIPNYKLENTHLYETNMFNRTRTIVIRDVESVYSGANHKQMKNFERSIYKLETWSTGVMSFEQTSQMLGRLRAAKRAR